MFGTVSKTIESRIQHSSLRATPTYRLKPKQKFNAEKCKEIIKTLVDEALDDFVYDSSEAESLASNLSGTILDQVKKLNFDRYKFVCNVTIAENSMQGFSKSYRCLRDKKLDKTAAYVHETPNAFVVAVVHGFYCY